MQMPWFRTTNIALLYLLLCGCEAELTLGGVNTELAKSTLRTDQYQAMISTDTAHHLFGNNGVVLSTKDTGVSWQRKIVDAEANFISADTCDNGTIIALSFDKRIWTSTDGENWVSRLIDTPEVLQKIVCAPNNIIWLTASFSTLLNSSDGGKSWKQQSMDEDALLTHVQFFDSKNGITAGEFGRFFTTSDGGENWLAGGQIGEEFYPIDVWFRNKNVGWAIGLNGVIYHSTDGGQRWNRQDNRQFTAPLYNIVGNDKHVVVLGDQGTALTLRNNTWASLAGPKIPVHFSSGAILEDSQNILVAGGSGAIGRIPLTIIDGLQ